MNSQIALKDSSGCAPSSSKGFTLIELLVVAGIVTVLLLAGAFVNFDVYGRNLLSGEEENLVSMLSKARSQSMNNIFAAKHGVHIDSDHFILFRGNSYDPGGAHNQEIERNPNITITGLNDIIFSQLSGEPNQTGDIVLNDNIRTKTVTVRVGGLIDW